MMKTPKSLGWLAAGVLLVAAAGRAQQAYEASVSRSVDRSTSRNFAASYSVSVNASGVAGVSGGGSAGGAATGATQSRAAARSGLSSANIASICDREASRGRVASACSSAGYTPRSSMTAIAPRKSLTSAAVSDGGGMAADDEMGPGGDDLAADPDALSDDASMGDGGDVPSSSAPAVAAKPAGQHSLGLRSRLTTTRTIHTIHRPAPGSSSGATTR